MTAPLKIVNVYDSTQGGPLPIAVPQSVATAMAMGMCSEPFVNLPIMQEHPESAHIGVDLLRLGPGEAFPLHTHPGNHLLLILKGRGNVTYDGKVIETGPGDRYLVDGRTEHAVGAVDAHYVLAFGAPHVEAHDPARMVLVDEVAEAPTEA